jgi:tRNA-(ms[2]io[6]A)-hydroxylase
MSTAVDSFLKYQSTQDWLDCVLSDFNTFLIDHAACERKASATCLSFVVKYPDKLELVDTMIRLAREELEHFHEVFHLLEQRNLKLGPDEKDPYVNQLIELSRTGVEERLMDRLLLSGIIEARGCERFFMIGQALKDPKLAQFYIDLSKSEERHHIFFVELARKHFPNRNVDARLEELLVAEAQIVAKLPLRPYLH